MCRHTALPVTAVASAHKGHVYKPDTAPATEEAATDAKAVTIVAAVALCVCVCVCTHSVCIVYYAEHE